MLWFEFIWIKIDWISLGSKYGINGVSMFVIFSKPSVNSNVMFVNKTSPEFFIDIQPLMSLFTVIFLLISSNSFSNSNLFVRFFVILSSLIS